MPSPNVLRVVVADDSNVVRKQLHNLLGRMDGVEIVADAETASEALEQVESYGPDVVILDVEMPGSGIQALRSIKAGQPGTVVVMLTNHAGSFFEKLCLRDGADYFLDKSVSFDRVSDVLAEIGNG